MRERSRFDEFVPRFLGLLRRLAAQGFVARTSDAMDILHDFYLDAWPGVVERFDPRVAPFDRYAVAAFARYARSWAARDAAFRRRFAPDVVLDSHPLDAPDPSEVIDARAVLAALESLPRESREILSYAFEEDLSDRALGRKLGVSRYVAAERLSEAVAALVATLSDRGLLPEVEQRLAHALFVEREPLELAASEAGVSAARGRLIRQRLLERFRHLSRRASS